MLLNQLHIQCLVCTTVASASCGDMCGKLPGTLALLAVLSPSAQALHILHATKNSRDLGTRLQDPNILDSSDRNVQPAQYDNHTHKHVYYRCHLSC